MQKSTRQRLDSVFFFVTMYIGGVQESLLCRAPVQNEKKQRYIMNRAFVSENDGWGFCKTQLEACIFADENGKCCLSYCRMNGEQPPAEEKQPEPPSRS